MKILFLVMACACSACVFAGDFRYDLSMPFYAGTIDNAGYVITRCDKCVLTSADIVSWSVTQTNPAMGPGFAGATFTGSSLAGSSVDIQGNGLVATPSTLTFNFSGGNPYAEVLFTSSSNSVQLSNTGDSLASPTGQMEDCSGKAGVCAESSYDGVQKLGNVARVSKVSAPELDGSGVVPTLTLLLGMLAVCGARVRRPVRALLRA